MTAAVAHPKGAHQGDLRRSETTTVRERDSASIADINLWDAFNKVYARVLGDNRPARAVIPCGPLHHGFLIEVEAIAATDL